MCVEINMDALDYFLFSFSVLNNNHSREFHSYAIDTVHHSADSNERDEYDQTFLTSFEKE